MRVQRQHMEETLVVQDISGSINTQNFSEAINLVLKGHLLTANIPQSERSAFQFQGDLFNFWTTNGKFNLDGLTLKGELNLELLPVRQLTGIIPMKGQTGQIIQAVLGEFINARLYGEISQLTGPLTIDVKSSNFKAILPLQINPNAIYLRDDVEAEITLTEEVNEAFLKDVNPLMQGGAYSDHPVKVYIEREGFMIPIRPYSFKGVRIEKAIFDIGKINILNDDKILALLNFLKVKAPPGRYIPAWFTPIFLNLKDGVATNKRFDALIANQAHIALWGKINLLNNRVNMVLGIAPSTLEQRFNITGLSKKDMFQVKMRGTTDNLELDWSSASTRIAIILAKRAGGGIGYIIGGIVEQIVTALGEEPTPPPTTDPFPWAVESGTNTK